MPLGPRRPLRDAASAAAEATGEAVAAALAGLARMRGGKAVHPHGVVHEATFRVDGTSKAPPGSALLSAPGAWPALVRFSRSVGVPRPLPDLLGVSIRIIGAYGRGRHQDFLFVTSVDLPVAHHVFLPARDFQQRLYSSSLPFRSGDRSFLLGARPDPASPRPEGGDEFERLAKAAESGLLRFEFVLAPMLGRFGRIGEIQIGSRLPDAIDALRFNPFNTGDDLTPAGVINEWRRDAYPRSQRAWGSIDRLSGAQERAESELRALEESRTEQARESAR